MNLDKKRQGLILAKLENKNINIYKDGKLCNLGNKENSVVDKTTIERFKEIMKTYIGIEKEYLFESIITKSIKNNINVSLIDIALRYICNPIDITNVDAIVNEFLNEEVSQEERCFIASLIVLFKNNGTYFIDKINNRLVELGQDFINVDDIIANVNKINLLAKYDYPFDEALDIINNNICKISYKIGDTIINSHVLLEGNGFIFGDDDLKQQPIIGKLIDNKFLIIYYISDNSIKKYIGYYNGDNFVMNIQGTNILTGFSLEKDEKVLQKKAIFYREIIKKINNMEREKLFNILKELNDYSKYVAGIRIVSARLGLHDAKTLSLN